MIFGVLYDTLPATVILLVTSAIIVTIALVMLRTSVLKEAHPEFYNNGTLTERTAG